jgi:two-component system alkaline phosphatase synthesis response regulator PhoP
MSRILIVEDEPDIAATLQEDLALEGHDVDTVGDGEAALARARSETFDLFVLDIMLPGVDGFDVCRTLRQSGVATPIMLLTAKSHEAEKVMGLDLGADDYVTKPFSPRELRARVRALLRRGGEAGQESLVVGDLEIDADKFELRKRGERIELTPLEFKLMAAMMRRRGVVLSRQQLLDAAWGSGTFVTERAVDTHVANLRRKIEDDPAAPRHIVSVHGVGYRFEE